MSDLAQAFNAPLCLIQEIFFEKNSFMHFGKKATYTLKQLFPFPFYDL